MPKPKVMTDEERAKCTEIDLPDLICYKIENDIGEDRYYVIPKKYYPFTSERPVCPFPNCGGTEVRIKDYQERTVLDIPRYAKPSRLVIKVARYICKKCGNPFQTPLESVREGSRMTVRLENFIHREAYELIPFSDIARRIGLDESNVVRFCDEVLKEDLDSYTIDFPEIIGVDEDHFKTYEKDYSFIITDPVNMRILDLWPSRETSFLLQEFRKQKGREKVIGITMDMSKDYRSVCEKMFTNAAIVCDRFHVIKLITKGLIEIKENILDHYKKNFESDKKKIKELEEDFSIIRDLMLINQEDLSEKSKAKLGHLLANYPEMSIAYIMKEEFRDIYSLSSNRNEAIKRYDDWADEVAQADFLFQPYKKLCDVTFRNWRMEFLNYFDFKEKGISVTNGPTEGLNSVVKSIMRTGRGFLKFDVLRAKCVLGNEVRLDRIITARMQRMKKAMMRKGVTDNSLFELAALREASIEAESESRKRRRDQKRARGTMSKQKRKVLSGDDDVPPDPNDYRKSTNPVQAEFDFSELE